MDNFIDHYTLYEERERLFGDLGAVELARSIDILSRHLPPQPQVILDVGGGPGVYSRWLASLGHEVHLIDPVPKHIEQAREASASQPERPISSVRLGDARDLPWEDGWADTVLLMGPLYHLTSQDDRLLALRESRRVLRPGGLLAAAAVSRYSPLFDGLVRGFIDDPAFAKIVERDLDDGQHRNPSGNLDYFTTAYMHHPDELAAELAEAGFGDIELFAVEGPAWAVRDLEERWADPARKAQLMELLRRVEREPSMLGASSHLLGVARR